jgi:hypothetical protein
VRGFASEKHAPLTCDLLDWLKSYEILLQLSTYLFKALSCTEDVFHLSVVAEDGGYIGSID